MSHNIRLILVNEKELREEKIDSIIENEEFEFVEGWVEMRKGILAKPFGNDINQNEYEFLKDLSEKIKVLLVQTDYFGGFGDQKAVLIHNRKEVFKENTEYKHCEPINTGLKMLGIERDKGEDEFSTIGLGSIRHNNDLNKFKIKKF